MSPSTGLVRNGYGSMPRSSATRSPASAGWTDFTGRFFSKPLVTSHLFSSPPRQDSLHRALIVNAFSHFNLILDQASARQVFDLGQFLGLQADSAERDALSLLSKGDVLGLDVYTAIGYRFLGHDNMSHADADWPDRLAKVRELAQRQGKQAWITA